jgi:5-formyltetrahydrofolate cyclo-ligase
MINIKDDVIKVGLSLFDPIDKISDINDKDIPLNFVVTPTRKFNFN